jgi:hypothetical protein
MASDTYIPPEQALTAPQPHEAESLRRGHEVTDARIRPIVVFVIVLFAGGAVIQGGAWWLWKVIEHRLAAAEPTPSPFGPTPSNPFPSAPPQPRLQPSVTHDSQPHEDMRALRSKWHEMLSGYGKVEGQPDRARIPIDRAMQLAVERGLPGRASATRPATRPAGGG